MILDNFDIEVLFSDFAIEAFCKGESIKIIFDENTINQTFQSVNVNGEDPIFTIKKCDFIRLNIEFDTEIEVDDEIYIVKDIRKSKTNIYKLKMILKD